MTDYKLSVTLKGTGGWDHPWIVIKDDTVEGVQALLSEAHEQDLFTALGRAHAAFLRGKALGSELGATTVKVEDEQAVKAPAKKAAKKAPAKTPAATPAATSAEPEEAPPVAPPIPAGAPKPAWQS